MAFEAEWNGLPNKQAIEFFRQKTTLPTKTWKDLDGAMHARAFVVAGATRDDLLADLRSAIDDAIAKGTTLETFRQRFDETVAKTGWAYNGGRNWRTRVIYETNLRTAHAVGRHKQMSDPDVVRFRPFWRYRHNDAVAHPRPEHQVWDGVVLRHDDPWWKTHYPPNGWGCQCFVQSLSQRELIRLGKAGPDQAPSDPLNFAGIDKGWNHNPGEAANGAVVSFSDDRPVALPDRFRPRDYPWVPAKLDPVPAPVALGPRARDAEAMREALPNGTYDDPLGNEVTIADGLVDQLGADVIRRAGTDRAFPLLADVIRNPVEIWVGFVREASGKVSLRWRYLKLYDVPGSDPPLGLVAELMKGQLVNVEAKTLQPLRRGWLAWPKAPEEPAAT